MWKSYTSNLVDSLTETEKEGLEKGYSSFEIEVLWQTRTKEQSEKTANLQKEKHQKKTSG